MHVKPSWHCILIVSKRNTRTKQDICSKLIIVIPERCHWRRSGNFIVNFDQISHCFGVFTVDFGLVNVSIKGFCKKTGWNSFQQFDWLFSYKKQILLEETTNRVLQKVKLQKRYFPKKNQGLLPLWCNWVQVKLPYKLPIPM